MKLVFCNSAVLISCLILLSCKSDPAASKLDDGKSEDQISNNNQIDSSFQSNNLHDDELAESIHNSDKTYEHGEHTVDDTQQNLSQKSSTSYKKNNSADNIPISNASTKEASSTKFSKQEAKKEIKLKDEKKWGNFLDSLKTKPQIFVVDPFQDTVLQCKKGTKIYIPANTFVYSNKKRPTKSLKISIKECTNIADFIGDKLTTHSKSGLLQTGGMLHISVSDGNEDLEICDTGKIALVFPKQPDLFEMNLYNGETDTNGFKSWTLDTNFKDETIVRRSNGENTSSTNSQKAGNSGKFFYYYKTCELDLKKGNDAYSSSDIKNDSIAGKYDPIYYLFRKKFKSNSKMRQEFCDCKLSAVINVTFDPEGNPYGIEFKSGSRPHYDSLFADFFYSLPKNSKSQSLASETSETIKMTISYKDKTDVTLADYNFNTKYQEFKNKAMEVTKSSELDSYILTSNGLGWLNCDIFNKYKGPRINVIISTLAPAATTVWLFFKQLRYVVPGTNTGSKIAFAQMPMNEPVKLIAVNYEELTPKMIVLDTRLTSEGITLDNYQTFTLDELIAALSLGFTE